MTTYDGRSADYGKGKHVNKEPLYVNKHIHHALTQRKFQIHQERIINAKPQTVTRFNPDRFRFMEERISLNYQLKMRSIDITKDNLLMLHRIASIKKTPGPHSKLRPRNGPRKHMKRLKALNRRREQDRIRRENSVYRQRWANPKPFYTRDGFNEAQAVQEKWLTLRSTDHTAGHILEVEKMRDEQRKGKPKSVESIVRAALGESVPMAMLHPEKFSGTTGDLPDMQMEFVVEPSEASYDYLTVAEAAERAARGLREREDHSSQRRTRASEGHSVGGAGGMGVTAAGRKLYPRRQSIASDDDEADDLNGEDGLTILGEKSVPVGAHNYTVRVFIKADAYDECLYIRTYEPMTGDVIDQRLVPVDDAFDVVEARKSTGGSTEDLHQVRAMLVNLFHEVDTDRSGTLSFDEFAGLMRKINLGITEPELRFVMAEADENEDGLIDYNEYIPVAVDIIQAFRSRSAARSTLMRMEGDIDLQLADRLNVEELDRQAHELTLRCQELDKRDTGTLRPIDLRAALRDKRVGMSPVEASLLVQALPRDAFGNVNYENIDQTLFDVRYRTLKNTILEAQGTDMQRYLMDLCRKEEMRVREANHGDESSVTGWISLRQLINVMINSPRLSLSRLQVMVVVSDAEVTDNMVNYWEFVPTAARTIEHMFDPRALRQRAQLIENTDLSPEVLLHGTSPEQFQRRLRTLFKSHDVDRSGELNPQQFRACLDSLDLHLTEAEILALMATADTDGNGMVDFDEFAGFCTDNLMHLERERHLRILQDRIHGRDNVSDDSASMQSGVQSKSSVELMEDHIRVVFEVADEDGSGELSVEEFRAVLDRLELDLTDFEFNVLMSELDENDDGQIDYEEFLPATARLIETFKAKRLKQNDVHVREEEAERFLSAVWPSMDHEVEAIIAYVEKMIVAKNDPSALFLQMLQGFQQTEEDRETEAASGTPVKPKKAFDIADDCRTPEAIQAVVRQQYDRLYTHFGWDKNTADSPHESHIPAGKEDEPHLFDDNDGDDYEHAEPSTDGSAFHNRASISKHMHEHEDNKGHDNVGGRDSSETNSADPGSGGKADNDANSAAEADTSGGNVPRGSVHHSKRSSGLASADTRGSRSSVHRHGSAMRHSLRRRASLIGKCVIKRSVLAQTLRDSATHLGRSTVNMILSRLPTFVEDQETVVVCNKLPRIIREVLRLQLKRYFLEEPEYEYIKNELNVLVESELRARMVRGPGLPSAGSSRSLVGGGLASDAGGAGQGQSGGGGPEFPQQVALNVVYEAMSKMTTVTLTYAQMLAVLSWREPGDDAHSDMIDREKFADHAARMVCGWFDMDECKRRSDITGKSRAFSEAAIMKDLTRQDLDHYLIEAFNTYDPSHLQYITEAQFGAILRGIPELNLSNRHATTIMASLMRSKGRDKGVTLLHWPRFFIRAYDTIYQLRFHEKLHRRLTLYGMDSTPTSAPPQSRRHKHHHRQKQQQQAQRQTDGILGADGGASPAKAGSATAHPSSGNNGISPRSANDMLSQDEQSVGSASQSTASGVGGDRSVHSISRASTSSSERLMELRKRSAEEGARRAAAVAPAQRLAHGLLQRVQVGLREGKIRVILPMDEQGMVRRNSSVMGMPLKRQLMGSASVRQLNTPDNGEEGGGAGKSVSVVLEEHEPTVARTAAMVPILVGVAASVNAILAEAQQEAQLMKPAGDTPSRRRSTRQNPLAGINNRPSPVRQAATKREPMLISFYAGGDAAQTQHEMQHEREKHDREREQALKPSPSSGSFGGNAPANTGDPLQDALYAAQLEASALEAGEQHKKQHQKERELARKQSTRTATNPSTAEEMGTVDPTVRVKLRHAVTGETWEGHIPVVLPSIALVDEDAAITFARNMTSMLALVEDIGTGKRTVGFDPSAAGAATNGS